ncbi:bifunctional riboflavin kinase/FAD synthetase [Chlamydia sp. 17-3921]|uniref:bifunctional riboflavin kinase/FAD synthetase n=1 Tax=Chlamydia sp. 17-3921 TaxID=2675798 RepID=UPI00191B71C2|nr:bifunctional riboflavin kinase/FAD synthetase [Chlamydia sp. 17-3921]
MEIFYSLATDFPIDSVTIGFFDGCHLGHKKLLSILTSYPGTSGIITFDPHPQKILSTSPRLITEKKERLQLLQAFPIDLLNILSFTQDFANQSAEVFISEVHSKLKCKRLILGHNSRLGKGGVDNIETLQPLGKRLNMEIIQVPLFQIRGQTVSSQKIRSLLSLGDLETANFYLGHPYKISGQVISGNGIGSSLGFATLNLIKENCLLPYGVYACEVNHNNLKYPAIMNLGEAPTVKRYRLYLEAHLFDFSGNLYGEQVSIIPKKYLRAEQTFSSKTELAHAIQKDILQAKAFFQTIS